MEIKWRHLEKNNKQTKCGKHILECSWLLAIESSTAFYTAVENSIFKTTLKEEHTSFFLYLQIFGIQKVENNISGADLTEGWG